MGFQSLHAVVYARQLTRLMMILGDALILTTKPCDKRHFVYDERVSDENIIAVLHDEGNGIVVDIAPRLGRKILSYSNHSSPCSKHSTI